jgi:hypothetical protein
MSSGRVQLASVGAQDVYLTGDPEFTFFLTVFKRHTKFASQAQEIVFKDVTFNFAKTSEAILPRFGDLVRAVYFKFDLPALTGGANVNQGYTDSVGNVIIDRAELLIGGQIVEIITGEYMELRQDLYTRQSHLTSMQDLVGTYYTRQGMGAATSDRTMIVPLPFYFHNNPALAIPQVALRYQEVSIRLKLRPINQLIVGDPAGADVSENYNDLTLVNPSLIVDYVFLEDREAKFFSNKQLTYPITQVQVSTASLEVPGTGTSTTEESYKLGFVNPVKELFFVIQDDSVVETNSATGNDWFNYLKVSDGGRQLQNLELYFNGDARITSSVADDLYLRVVQPLDYHTKAPNHSFYVYSFALDPEEYQPTGQVNMSRINNVRLVLNLRSDTSGTKKTVKVYAQNYNIMKIQSGVAGVLFNFQEN